MQWWWWIIPGAVGVIGLAIVLSGIGWMFRGRPFKGGRGVIGGGFLLAIGAVVALLGLNVQTYNRLSTEYPVAKISLERTGDRTFIARVTDLNKDGDALAPPQTYELTGNEVQLDARVISWKPWATVLGFDARYELQHIWGRTVAENEPLTAGGERLDVKKDRMGIDVTSIGQMLGGLSPVNVVQHNFGSAVYMPMADKAEYYVCITEDALVADPANGEARGAIEVWLTRSGATLSVLPERPTCPPNQQDE
jgi:hypothetical protein